MNLIAVYGSLRPSEYNYERFKEVYEDIQDLGEETLEGFDLYSLGAYPGIKHGDGTLVVNILRCDDECYDRIENMEIGAGYKPEIVETLQGEATIFVYKPPVGKKDLIPHGDWTKRKDNLINY
jgi:gamma-glutamylcyclotransferase (GGCT)/AIG2-like uncharacterized protein YtfP